jgi:transposase-like protein
MKPPSCIKCELALNYGSIVRRNGFYYRTSDSKWVTRFRCTVCGSSTSSATFDIHYRQKKRRKNPRVAKLLSSGVSLRRTARLENLNRKTVVRMFRMEALKAELSLRKRNARYKPATTIQFDDMETFEQTKCKPLSITLAVEEGTRRILGVEVSQMPASGMLTKKAKALYGARHDTRREGRGRLLAGISPFVDPAAVIKSDENPFYPALVKEVFPLATHVAFKGKRGSLTGYGEIKKVNFDPLFSLNHTCAMFRDSVKRLSRKTWCTTKRASQLYAHLVLYADYHNRHLPCAAP